MPLDLSESEDDEGEEEENEEEGTDMESDLEGRNEDGKLTFFFFSFFFNACFILSLSHCVYIVCCRAP